MSNNIRVRIILTRLDPVKPRLWEIMRRDLAQQMTDYFHARPELGMDQGEVTVIHTGVTRSVAQVGLHAPAFAQAVGNMLRQYGLPQRFNVSVSILTTPASITREALAVLHRSIEPTPEGEGFTWLGMAEEQVHSEAGSHARA